MADTQDKRMLEKETALTLEIERLLPDFARSCRESANMVIIHQDSFAADYEDDEYILLGKAIKFAGLHGKEVRVIGRNRETLKSWHSRKAHATRQTITHESVQSRCLAGQPSCD